MKRSALIPHQRSADLLSRMLDDPSLVGQVQALEPRALARIVEHIGIEDAGELVSMATPEQLLHVLDEALWESARAGDDEAFDADRFRTWLEVLLEAGEEAAADKLAELSEDLLAYAFSELTLVVDLDELAMTLDGRPEEMSRTEQALEGCLYIELDQYRVMGRRHEGWDALATLLATLDQRHPHLTQRLLERCKDAAHAHIEEAGGLYEVLSDAEMLAEDAAAEREERRAREGYVAPSSARAFLRLAAASDVHAVIAEPGRDPVTRAYFRELDPTPRAPSQPVSADLRALLGNAAGADVPLIGTTTTGSSRFRDALTRLSESDPERHRERTEELAYLVNVVTVGCAIDGRRPRPWEAAQLVLDACDRGLDALAHAAGDEPDAVVARFGADALFRAGWTESR